MHFFKGSPPSFQTRVKAQEKAQTRPYAIFRARSAVMTPNFLGQMDRRDRITLILLDGKRTIEDVARLTHRNELEITRILIRLLQRGLVEFLGA